MGNRPSGAEYDQPYFIGVQLNGLVPDRLHSLNLFDTLDGEQSRTRLLEAMDELNNKYGLSTLAPATMLTAYKAAPTRIAFTSIRICSSAQGSKLLTNIGCHSERTGPRTFFSSGVVSEESAVVFQRALVARHQCLLAKPAPSTGVV